MRGIGYIRVSTTEQAAEGVSLEAQRVKLEAYAAFKGIELIEVVVDAGVSAGKPLEKRPGGARVLEAVATGEAGAVLAVKLDRLFRDAADCLNNTKAWDRASVGLHLLDIGVDTSTPMGRAFLTIAAAFAELERSLSKSRTRDGLEQVRREGGTLGAEGFGWRRDTSRTDEHGRAVVVVVQAEVKAIQRIRALRAEGLPWRAVAAALTAEGIPTKNGGRWQAATAMRIHKRTRKAA